MFKCTVCPPRFYRGAPLFLIFSARRGAERERYSGSLAHFLGMLPPKVRFPCSPVSLSSSRTRGTGSLSFWATRPSLPPVPASGRSNDVFLHVQHASPIVSCSGFSSLLVFVRPLRFSSSLFLSFFSSFVFRLPSNASSSSCIWTTFLRSLSFSVTEVSALEERTAFCSSWSVGRSVGLGQGLWVNNLGDSNFDVSKRVLSTRFEYL